MDWLAFWYSFISLSQKPFEFLYDFIFHFLLHIIEFDVNCTCLVDWMSIAIIYFILSLILPLNFSYLIAKLPWYHINFVYNKMVITPTFTIVVLKFIDCVQVIGAPVTQLLASLTRRICVYFITLHDKNQYSVLFNSASKTDFWQKCDYSYGWASPYLHMDT